MHIIRKWFVCSSLCLMAGVSAQCPTLGSASPSTLPNVTGKAFVFAGYGFSKVTSVVFGSHRLTSRSADDWDNGFFETPSDTRLLVYPPQGLVPGQFRVQAFRGACGSKVQTVRLFFPKIRYTRSNKTLTAGKAQVLRACKADMPDSSLGVLTVSPSKKPSRIAGVLSLGIGNAFLELLVLLPPKLFDAKSKVATWRFSTPLTLRQVTLHFQTVLIDGKNPDARPFKTTDVQTTVYR